MLARITDPASYAYSSLSLQTVFVSFVAFSIGVFVLGRELNSRVRISFFLLTTAISFWLFAFSRMYAAVDVQAAFYWAKTAYLAIAFIPAANYTFSAVLLRDFHELRPKITAAWLICAAFCIQILLTNTVFDSLYHYSWGYYPHYRLMSIPFVIYCVCLITCVPVRLFRASGVKLTSKNIWPVATAFAGGTLATLDFAPAYGLDYYPEGYVFVFLFIIIVVYLMSVHRFPNVVPGVVASRVIDTMQDALLVLDRNGIINSANRAAGVLLGLEADKLEGRRLRGNSIGNRFLLAEIEAALNAGPKAAKEITYPRQDGSEGTISLSLSLIRDWTGDVLYHVCVLHDITERFRLERALEQSNFELARQLSFTKTLLETEPVAVFYKDAEGRYLGCNEEFSKIVGVSPEDIKGKTVFDLWPRELAAKYHEQDMALILSPGRQRYEFAVQPVRGDTIDVIFTKDVFRDETGAVQGIVGTFIDITDRKRAEAKIKMFNDDLEKRVQQRTAQLVQVNDALQKEIAERLRAEETLRESESKYRTLIEQASDGIFLADGNGRYIDVNSSGCKLLGYSRDEILRLTMRDVTKLTSENPLRMDELREGKVLITEREMIHKNGSLVLAEISAKQLPDGRLQGIVRDITKRRQAEDELRTNRIFLHNILNSIQDPIVVLDRNRNILLANKTFETEFAAKNMKDYIGRSCHEVLFDSADPCGTCLSEQSTRSCAVSHKVIDKADDRVSSRWYDVFGYPLFATDGRVVGNVHQLRDITERKKAEQTIAKNQEQLRSLTHQLLMSEEQERKRISRELHDEMGQMLTGIKLSLQEITQAARPEVAAKVTGIQQDIGDLMVRIRELSANLRPAMLDDLGLVPALQWHIGRFTRQTGMQVDFDHEGTEKILSQETSLTLFRIVQEAMTNAVRHSETNRVAVIIRAFEKSASVTIRDEGVGFDPGEALNSGMTLGLAGMRERVEMAGGAFIIRSARGRGTEIRCEFPIER